MGIVYVEGGQKEGEKLRDVLSKKHNWQIQVQET